MNIDIVSFNRSIIYTHFNYLDHNRQDKKYSYQIRSQKIKSRWSCDYIIVIHMSHAHQWLNLIYNWFSHRLFVRKLHYIFYLKKSDFNQSGILIKSAEKGIMISFPQQTLERDPERLKISWSCKILSLE
jgi:hypothetical protein